jgi:hypothetical protein
VVATETMRREDVLENRKRRDVWEIRAVRKIRKKGRNRTPKNRNKRQKTSLISSPKEGLDRNYGTEICTTSFAV